MRQIYRVQDEKGRGPWRPGFSHLWVEPDREIPAPFYVEFPDIDLAEAQQKGNLGCGCASLEQLKKWFSEDEYNRLLLLGYKAVRMKADSVVRESENQVVFIRQQALRKNVVRVHLY